MPTATILFICTGNICRSPLAEAVARGALAESFQVTNLTEIGLFTVSGGTHALAGRPATKEMRTVAAEIGLDLSMHRAGQADPRAIADASLVYAMEVNQARWARSLRPGSTVELLGTAEIDDPYGADLREYRRVRDEIVAAVTTRLPEMIALAG